MAYMFGFIIGYFGIMLLFMLIALIRAKKGNPWVWYFTGAGIQLISLIGASRNPFLNSSRLWAYYFVILILSLLFIGARYSKRDEAIDEAIDEEMVPDQTV